MSILEELRKRQKAVFNQICAIVLRPIVTGDMAPKIVYISEESLVDICTMEDIKLLNGNFFFVVLPDYKSMILPRR